jgi:RNA polymerase sigma-70 factor (ECF subfamily)
VILAVTGGHSHSLPACRLNDQAEEQDVQTLAIIHPTQTSPSVRDQMLALIPSLRAFAISLTRDSGLADDLVQDTLIRAWANLDRFEQGTNMGAWLFTILRNSFYSQRRKQRWEVEDVEGQYARRLVSSPAQHGHLDFQDLRNALWKLPPEQREVLLLATAQGLSYDDVAQICGCAVGTVKSRIHRARVTLGRLLAVADPDDIGPDGVTKAALQASA